MYFTKRSALTKFVSVLLTLTFSFFDVSFGASTPVTGQSADTAEGKITQLTPGMPISVEDIGIAIDSGSIKQKYQATGEKVVIHIQDAHCNFEAQQNINKILDQLRNEMGLDMISVEGAEGIVDTSWFKAFPDAEIRKEVATYFMKKGEITGAEFFSITTDYSGSIFGAETRDYYIQNLKAFTKTYPFKEIMQNYFTDTKSIATRLKGLIYSPNLKELDMKIRAFEDKEIELSAFAAYLNTCMKRDKVELKSYENFKKLVDTLEYEGKINFDIVDSERSAYIDLLSKKLGKDEMAEMVTYSIKFKKGHIKPVDFYTYLRDMAEKKEISIIHDYPNLFYYYIYTKLYAGIDNEGLFKEIDAIETVLKNKLFQDDTQRKLDRYAEMINMFNNLINIELTNDDYDIFNEYSKDVTVETIVSFLDSLCVKYGISADLSSVPEQIVSNIPNMVEFYEVAMKRDQALIDNTINEMNRSGKNLSVLITGGFHTRGMMKLLEGAGISYVVVMPKITKDVETPYIKVLTNQRTSLEDIITERAMPGTETSDKKQTVQPSVSKMLSPILRTYGLAELYKEAAGTPTGLFERLTRELGKTGEEFAEVAHDIKTQFAELYVKTYLEKMRDKLRGDAAKRGETEQTFDKAAQGRWVRDQWNKFVEEPKLRDMFIKHFFEQSESHYVEFLTAAERSGDAEAAKALYQKVVMGLLNADFKAALDKHHVALDDKGDFIALADGAGLGPETPGTGKAGGRVLTFEEARKYDEIIRGSFADGDAFIDKVFLMENFPMDVVLHSGLAKKCNDAGLPVNVHPGTGGFSGGKLLRMDVDNVFEDIFDLAALRDKLTEKILAECRKNMTGRTEPQLQKIAESRTERRLRRLYTQGRFQAHIDKEIYMSLDIEQRTTLANHELMHLYIHNVSLVYDLMILLFEEPQVAEEKTRAILSVKYTQHQYDSKALPVQEMMEIWNGWNANKAEAITRARMSGHGTVNLVAQAQEIYINEMMGSSTAKNVDVRRIESSMESQVERIIAGTDLVEGPAGLGSWATDTAGVQAAKLYASGGEVTPENQSAHDMAKAIEKLNADIKAGLPVTLLPELRTGLDNYGWGDLFRESNVILKSLGIDKDRVMADIVARYNAMPANANDQIVVEDLAKRNVPVAERWISAGAVKVNIGTEAEPNIVVLPREVLLLWGEEVYSRAHMAQKGAETGITAKILTAANPLSVQFHIFTEMFIPTEVQDGQYVYMDTNGKFMKDGVPDIEGFISALEDRDTSMLNKVRLKAGVPVIVPAGTLHAYVGTIDKPLRIYEVKGVNASEDAAGTYSFIDSLRYEYAKPILGLIKAIKDHNAADRKSTREMLTGEKVIPQALIDEHLAPTEVAFLNERGAYKDKTAGAVKIQLLRPKKDLLTMTDEQLAKLRNALKSVNLSDKGFGGESDIKRVTGDAASSLDIIGYVPGEFVASRFHWEIGGSASIPSNPLDVKSQGILADNGGSSVGKVRSLYVAKGKVKMTVWDESGNPIDRFLSEGEEMIVPAANKGYTLVNVDQEVETTVYTQYLPDKAAAPEDITVKVSLDEPGAVVKLEQGPAESRTGAYETTLNARLNGTGIDTVRDIVIRTSDTREAPSIPADILNDKAHKAVSLRSDKGFVIVGVNAEGQEVAGERLEVSPMTSVRIFRDAANNGHLTIAGLNGVMDMEATPEVSGYKLLNPADTDGFTKVSIRYDETRGEKASYDVFAKFKKHLQREVARALGQPQ
ncbi:MAG: hypothetical protein HQL30_05535, partial [Candidatus Omnitrophica bacterium]|nr:hypothetical protein [Candidatus Omnitrophota bacterium]